jgi:egghead protein (zeste-white 4 protein)
MNAQTILLPAILLLNATYVYYWFVVLYARANKHIDKRQVTDADINVAIIQAKSKGDPYLFTIQITTRGGNTDVVCRGIDNIYAGFKKYPALRDLYRIEVITEDMSDIITIGDKYTQELPLVGTYLLPPDYQTPNNTKLKARALQYMVDIHRQNPRNAYIVHFDEESVLTPDNLARLTVNLLRKPVAISEGTISYALDWKKADPICRTMESNRPFGCHECYLVMTNPVPLHLHGSNLVIQESLENEIGWDIGQYKGNALIAEDLVFGLKAYIKYGRKAFGWHHVEMIEQPPFTIEAAYKQRERWVMGALQGVAYAKDIPGYQNLSKLDRFKIQWLIRLRILTYAIGFPVSVISIVSALWLVGYNGFMWGATGNLKVDFSLLAIPGLLLWFGATQVGLHQNLSYTGISKWEKF